jgi:hypothetical protein
MISTVTTTTVSTIVSSTSTTSTIAMLGFATSLALVSIITLFVLLVQKELVTAADSPRFKALGRTLDVAVVPLLMAFAMIAINSVVQVLR